MEQNDELNLLESQYITLSNEVSNLKSTAIDKGSIKSMLAILDGAINGLTDKEKISLGNEIEIHEKYVKKYGKKFSFGFLKPGKSKFQKVKGSMLASLKEVYNHGL